jgi:uncharacterized membrane protein YdbT with pleckstrin-like domain
MFETKRLHPLQVLRFSGKYLFLLLLPALRGLLTVRNADMLLYWAKGAWFDLCIVITVIVLFRLSGKYNTIQCDRQRLIVQTGIFFRRKAMVPLTHITTLWVESPFYLRPFNAKRVCIDTAGGKRPQVDLNLILYPKEADKLLSYRTGTEDTPRRYRTKWQYLLFLSVYVSGTLTGILFFATALHQLGKLLGEQIQNLVVSGVNTLAEQLWFVPHTAAIAAIIVLLGWGLSFVRNLLHFSGFSVTRYHRSLCISAGLLNRREYTCHIRDINFLNLRQTLLGKLLQLYMVYIHCIGYGKRKRDQAVLLPGVGPGETRRIIKDLLWEFPIQDNILHPAPFSLWRYLRWPLLTLLGVAPAVTLSIWFIPEQADLLRFLGLVLVLPIVWWGILQGLGRYDAGVAVDKRSLTLRYPRLFVLHTVVIPCQKISCLRIRQSVWQQKRNRCDLIVYTCNERRTRHCVKNLTFTDLKTLLYR